MMTPQEVSSKTFPKAVMGGYAMAAVDEFLDALTEDYGSLYKENAALKAKTKGLMEKIEEYRQLEDAMRSTLLAAQKMAKSIVAEAETKRDAIAAEAEAHKSSLVADAETAAKQRIAQLKDMVAAEELRLEEKQRQVAAEIATEDQKLEKAKVAVSRFMQVTRANCEEQLKILQRLEELVPEPVAVPAAPVIPTVPAEPEPVEESVLPEIDMEQPVPAEDELVLDQDFFTSPLPTMEDLKKVQTKVEDEPADIQSAVDELAVEAEPDQESIWDTLPEDATRIINLDELQFGRNYNKEE